MTGIELHPIAGVRQDFCDQALEFNQLFFRHGFSLRSIGDAGRIAARRDYTIQKRIAAEIVYRMIHNCGLACMRAAAWAGIRMRRIRLSAVRAAEVFLRKRAADGRGEAEILNGGQSVTFLLQHPRSLMQLSGADRAYDDIPRGLGCRLMNS